MCLHSLDPSAKIAAVCQPCYSLYMTPGTCLEVDLFPKSTNYTAGAVSALLKLH